MIALGHIRPAFFWGQRTNNNVIIVKELLARMKRAQGRKGFMAFDIDLEKARDRIEWDFTRRALVARNFPSGHSLFSTASLAPNAIVLLNGRELGDPFALTSSFNV